MNSPTQIYCYVRKKWLVRTPEEEVRQDIIKYLNLECGAPLELMACEYPLALGAKTYRSDLVLHGRNGQPLLMAEFKAKDIVLGQDALYQLKLYNTVLHAPYLLLSNGIQTVCCRFSQDDNKYVFLTQIPAYSDMNSSF